MKNIIIASLALISAPVCLAWGQKGHDVTACIAERHLTETTKYCVDSILDGKSMVYWANWLDNASHTPEYAYTSTWHYKNIDPQYSYEDAPVHPQGNIITALTSEIDSLSTGAFSPERSALSLKIIVHLMGDLHQPMHMGRLSDRGGNDTKVIFFKRDNNLHSIWDSSVVESGHKWSYTEWQQQIDRMRPCCEAQIIRGSVDDWGKDTYTVALDVYEKTPFSENLSYDYVAEWTPVIECQLEKAGLRLAHVLNKIFDPAYTPPQPAATCK